MHLRRAVSSSPITQSPALSTHQYRLILHQSWCSEYLLCLHTNTAELATPPSGDSNNTASQRQTFNHRRDPTASPSVVGQIVCADSRIRIHRHAITGDSHPTHNLGINYSSPLNRCDSTFYLPVDKVGGLPPVFPRMHAQLRYPPPQRP